MTATRFFYPAITQPFYVTTRSR